jgi:hypothetical protein
MSTATTMKTIRFCTHRQIDAMSTHEEIARASRVLPAVRTAGDEPGQQAVADPQAVPGQVRATLAEVDGLLTTERLLTEVASNLSREGEHPDLRLQMLRARLVVRLAAIRAAGELRTSRALPVLCVSSAVS